MDASEACHDISHPNASLEWTLREFCCLGLAFVSIGSIGHSLALRHTTRPTSEYILTAQCQSSLIYSMAAGRSRSGSSCQRHMRRSPKLQLIFPITLPFQYTHLKPPVGHLKLRRTPSTKTSSLPLISPPTILHMSNCLRKLPHPSLVSAGPRTFQGPR